MSFLSYKVERRRADAIDWVHRFEGDNYVLDKQVVRAALKSLASLISSTHNVSSPQIKLSPFTDFLRLLLPTHRRPPTVTSTSWESHKIAIELLEWRAAVMVRDLFQDEISNQNSKSQNRKQSTSHDGEVKLDAGVQNRVAQAITEAYVATQVGEIIESGLSAGGLSGREMKVMGDLMRLVSAIHGAYIPLFFVP